jgi:UDP-N-acetylmuramyl pentapeptide phosphotransferase/UDP-N-acetylglucosamine-1-phosphate transferase
MSVLLQDLVTASCTAAAALVLVRVAPRTGWVDASEGPDAGRKLQRRPVACAGGAALFVGVLVSLFLRGDRSSGFAGIANLWSPWVLPSLGVAFLVGLVDDVLPRGLSAGKKLAGQFAAGLVLAAPMLIRGELVSGVTWVLLAVVAQNAANTFDNFDGAAVSVSALALAFSPTSCAAAVAGLLPFNLPLARRGARLYLGDSGSHLLGIVLLLNPLAWGAFALMLCDLARVCIERMQAGQPIWVGDRRHLAHRFERTGTSALAIVGRLVVIAAPAIVAVGMAGSIPAIAWGAAITLALFALGVATSRAPAPVTGSGSSPLSAGARREP